MEPAELELVRSSIGAALQGPAADTAVALAEFGWDDLLIAVPSVATAELFEAQGRFLATTPSLDRVVARLFGLNVAAGVAVVHPPLGSRDRPPGTVRLDGTVDVDGLVLGGSGGGEMLLVPSGDGTGRAGVTVTAASALERRAVAGFDPALRLVTVRGAIRGPGDSASGEQAEWARVAAAARRALAHELCGLTEAMLSRAARHVSDRHQFGRPIAAFQTVRHRLTEVFVAVAAARSVLAAAWTDDEPLLCDAAKVAAGRAAGLATRHCLQVTGAMGFTEEYGLAGQIRRAGVLNAFYGSADELVARIGSQLLQGERVPRFCPLA